MSKGDTTRRSIVSHAIQLASREGLDGLTIGGLARDLGLSKSGLFAHFRSKEQLQLQVLGTAAQRFVDFVVLPALREPRGEPRVVMLFERWLLWGSSAGPTGGCVFVAASSELDDRPGPLREALLTSQSEWTGALARAASIAVEEGHFRDDLDCAQFAFETYSILLGFHLYRRLMQDSQTERRARASFDALLTRSRASSKELIA